MKIVADEKIPYINDYFSGLGELVLVPGRSISKEIVADADILLVRSIMRVDANLLAGSSVKFVGSVTAGCDHLDEAWLKAQGIQYSATPGFNAPPVADYVVCVLAALQRRQLFPQQGARAAVIGVGNAGKLVAARLEALGIEVVLCDPIRAMREPDFKHVELQSIRHVNLISLHVPLTRIGKDATYHMINADFLKQQEPGCVLINASRGGVLDTAAAFAAEQLFNVCLDVYEGEPQIAQDIFLRAVMTTPHIAGYSVQARKRGIAMLYDYMCEHGIIYGQPIYSELPRQRLSFAGYARHWQDIVIGIFNPLLMTIMLQTKMLEAEDAAREFDVMRDGFHYRHEFAFTDVVSEGLLEEDRKILERLGVRLCSQDETLSVSSGG